MRFASKEIFSKSCEVIPAGVNSPVRSFQAMGFSPPLIVESGNGSLIRDVDGREYIDFCGSWGALILGHAHPKIVTAVQEQVTKGSSFGIATAIEEQLARKVVQLVPAIEKLRFVCSGTEAGMTALRLARGYTERPKIIKFTGHYHGHADALLIQAGSGVSYLNPGATSKGVTEGSVADTICLPFNDFDVVRGFFRTSPLASQVAAVILEPITGNMGVVLPEPGFLDMLREETRCIGALLIFDEVITGFRVGLHGAAHLYGIDPDLILLGKVVGGGFPVAAVGGKAKILDTLAPLGQVYQAGTLAGNPIAMRAGLTTLQILEEPQFYQTLEEKTAQITEPLRAAIEAKGGCLQRCGSMFSLFFGLKKVTSKENLAKLDEKTFIRLFCHLFDRGIYIPPSSHEAWFVSSAHTPEQLEFVLKEICLFLNIL